jgi:flagellar protein FlaG
MSMEITGIVGQVAPPAGRPAGAATGVRRTPEPEVEIDTPDIDIDRITEDLRIVSHAFNHRLEFSINRDLNQVVVKVIDRETDKVIKELPSEELQRVHVRVQEAIGLLIDEEV